MKYDMRNKFRAGCYGANMHERIKRKVAQKARMAVVERLWTDGVKRDEIARKLGVSVPLIDCDLKSLRALGRIEPRNRIGGPRPVSERSSRADDERLLSMLALRDEGVSGPEIGRRLGIPGEYVRAATNRVRRDYELSLSKWWTGREWVETSEEAA